MVKSFFKNYRKILFGAVGCLVLIILLITTFLFIHNTRQIISTDMIQMQDIADNLDRYNLYFDNVVSTLQNEDNTSITAAAELLELSGITDDFSVMQDYAQHLGKILCILDKDRNIAADELGMFDQFDFHDARFDALFNKEDREITETYSDEHHFTSYAFGDGYLVTLEWVFISEEVEDPIDTAYLSDETLKTTINNSWIEDNSIWAVTVYDDDEIVFSKDPALEGTKIDVKNIQKSLFYNLNGKANIVAIYPCEEMGMNLLAFTPVEAVARSSFFSIRVEIILFIVILVLLISFVIFLRADELDASSEFTFLHKHFLHTQVRRYIALAVACGISIFSLCILLSDLSNISGMSERLKEQAEKNAVDLVDMQHSNAYMKESSDSGFYQYGNMINTFLNSCKEPVTKDTLVKAAAILDVLYISVFDADGNTIVSSSPMDHISLLDDPESPLYELRYVLMGKPQMSVSGDANRMGPSEVLYAVPRRDEDGVADGLIAITVTNWQAESQAYVFGEEEENADTYYNLRRQLDDSIIFVADKDGIITLHPEKKWIGKPVSDYGIALTDLQKGFSGRIKVNNEVHLASSVEYEDRYIVATGRIRWFEASVVLRALISLVLFTFLAFWIFYDGLGSQYHFEERKAKVKDADDWKNTKVTWADLNTKQKFAIVIRYFVYAFSLYLLIIYFLGSADAKYDLGFNYILSGAWSKGFNIFAIIGNVCLISVVHSVVSWIKFFLKMVSRAAGEETFSRLLSSVVRYAGAVIVFYFAATNFGIDARAAWTSLGLAGVGLSFGAQDLIKDVIAGIFILFEGNYKVGDMLLINNEWYWVKSIGVRTTKVAAWGQVKIINNSQMTSGVTNIQNASACVNCDIYVGKEYELNDIEEILNNELPKLKEKYPPEVATPSFKGVQNITAYGTQIRIRTYCPPMLQGRVGRSLRTDIARIFKEYGIRVPSVSYELFSFEVKKEDLMKEVYENAKIVNESAEHFRRDRENEMM